MSKLRSHLACLVDQATRKFANITVVWRLASKG